MAPKKLSDLKFTTPQTTKPRKSLSSLGWNVSYTQATPIAPPTPVAKVTTTGGRGTINRGVVSPEELAKADTSTKSYRVSKTPELYKANTGLYSTRTAPQIVQRTVEDFTPATPKILSAVGLSGVHGVSTGIKEGQGMPSSLAAYSAEKQLQMIESHLNDKVWWNPGNPSETGGKPITHDAIVKMYEDAKQRVANNNARMLFVRNHIAADIAASPNLYSVVATGDKDWDAIAGFTKDIGSGLVSEGLAMGISAITGGLAAPIVAPLFGLWSLSGKYAEAIGAGVDGRRATQTAEFSGLVNWFGEYLQLGAFGRGKNLLTRTVSDEAQDALTALGKKIALDSMPKVLTRLGQLKQAAGSLAAAYSKLTIAGGAKAIGTDMIENGAQEMLESLGEDAGDYLNGVKQFTADSAWASLGKSVRVGIIGAILGGGASVMVGGASYAIDSRALGNIKAAIQEAAVTVQSAKREMDIAVELVKSANSPEVVAELRQGVGILNPAKLNAKGFAVALQTQPVAISSVERTGEKLNNWGRTTALAEMLGVKPNRGTYTGMDGETTHENSFIFTNVQAGFNFAAASGQESVLFGDGLGHWWFIDPRTHAVLGTASGINFAPLGDKTRVTLASKKGMGFSFDNVEWGVQAEATPEIVAAVESKGDSPSGMGYNEQGQQTYYSGPDTATSGTSPDIGMESVGTAQMPIGSYDKTIKQGTTGFTSTTSGNTTESTLRVADKIIHWSSSVVKGGTVEVIQTTVSDKGERVDNTPQLLRNIEDIKKGNFVITANGADAQFLSGIEFTEAGVRGAWAQGADISSLLNTGKTHIILIYELAGMETPRGHITYPSLINNPTYVALLEAYAPETMAKLRAEAARRQVLVDAFNVEMTPIVAAVGKSEKLNAEAVIKWNAEHPNAKPIKKIKLKDDVFWYNAVTVKEETELNRYAVLMTTPHNRDAHDRVVGAFILNGCYVKDNFIFPREVQSIVNTYSFIDWGTALVFKKPVEEQFVRSKLVSSVVEVTGQKKSVFDFSKTAQKQSYVASAKEMVPVVDEILSSLEEFVGAGRETGQSTLSDTANVDAPMELEKYGVKRLPQESLDMIQVALERYHQSRAVLQSGTSATDSSAVSNYQTQYGGQQYSGTGMPPTIMTFTPGGNPVLINQQGQPVATLPTLLKTKPLKNATTQSALAHKEELYKDDINALRSLGYLDGYTYKLLTAIRGSSTITEYAILHGKALLPDGKKQAFAPGVKLTPFMDFGETLKKGGLTEQDLNRFSVLYAASRGNPVNVESMPEVNMLKQGKGTLAEKLAKVKAAGIVGLRAYSPEQFTILKGVMDGAHKYLTPIVNAMHAKGMPLGENLDSGAITVDEWIDAYVSSAEPKSGGKYGSSSPMQEKHIETVSHKQVTGYLNGIVNTMNNYNQWFMYNEYVKRFATEMGYVSDTAVKDAPTFFADDGTVKYVDAPEHIKRQLTSVISRAHATSRLFNSDIYSNVMTLSRELKLMTPAFAQTNLIRDASLVLTREGIHPVAMANTILKLIIGKSEKSSGLVGMGTPNELSGNVLTDFQNIDHAVALTHVQRVFQYLHDNVLGISESLMRNYAYNVEAAGGKSEIEQMYALIASSADFTVFGSSEAAANVRKAWQFSQASLDVAMSWDLAIKELGTKMASPNMGTKFEGFSGAALLIAGIAAGIAFKAREKERKELQDFVTQNKIPIRFANKIITVPEGFNQGALLENTISTIVSGIMSGDSVSEITDGLGHDVYAGIVGFLGRDGDPTLNSIVSTLTPTIFEPITRVFLNTQYGGGEIDPMTWGANWTHYFNSTTKVAKTLARLAHDATGGELDVSPIKMDYLIKSYLARYGTALTKMDSEGAKSAVSGFFAQQFVIPVPEGIKTQAYRQWKEEYARIADDLAQAKKGNYPISQDMVRDLQLLSSIDKLFPKQQTAQGVFALSLYGLAVLDTYSEHRKERR